ncbi:7-cyano-7-deazaguanine synthase QueC [Methanococcoides alaskense]|uniref:7-cyano-7-deazaguanine synthase n=1 Tax=Methanococcoides alaskense TaxID=325778 RepID=A0AA90TXS0_9EURY|nr:7-cyano-7-deazaguanine synthase QueC [Methanococcoides alaskense]MDA0525186.1 7-cyano-7-deazaguanine synthase QueC [Methanococcoides alaskense]MDR6221892.1 7-cyano-7-deazaguanine synthase [Methanococcoides alaskense]
MRSILLLSSGLDSVAALAIALQDHEVVMALTFDYGQRSVEKEIENSRAVCEHYDIEHRIIPLKWLGSITNTSLVNKELDVPELSIEDIVDDASNITVDSAKNVWVPNRNGVFINIAASFAENYGCEYVIAGFNGEEAKTFPDNSKEFVNAVDECFSYSTANGVKVLAPLIDMDKVSIVRKAMELGAPLEWSWSCYHGAEVPCGVCESCMRRKRAFLVSEFEDPLTKKRADLK